MRYRNSWRPHRLVLTMCLVAFEPFGLVRGTSGAEQGDGDRDRRVMERFLEVLERTPRRGTALDRVYGYHVERGTLDALVEAYRGRVAGDPKDGTAWLLLGLIESQRGRDAEAVAALRDAEAHRPDDAMPSYYLGQELVLVGQPAAAAEAYERALARNPPRADMLEIFQALGRVHQRARRNDQALAVWARMEKQFASDPRVQEQIASALAEESQLEPALARYEALAESARDPYRRVRFRAEAADLKVRLGRQADALRDFEGLLSGLNPDSWLFRETRRKIEDVFLRDDDQAGLARYYERWLEAAPDDVEAMARLGRTLAAQGRAAEARSWLDRALKLAPSRKELRLALIEQLVQDGKYAEAAAQYEVMSRADPNNPDRIRDWGRLLLKDTSQPEAARKRAAAAVWRRLVEARPKDASAAAQVADLFRQAEMPDEAITLYRKAVELAPESPQYREYLGEYYHTLTRTDEALATWRGIAAGPGRNANNLARLGEVLAGFGYKAEAARAVSEACELDPESFDLRLKHADLLLEARRYDDADAQLAAAEKLADDEDRREAVLGRRIANDQAAGRLPERVEALGREVAGDRSRDAEAWGRLARYNEAARRPVEAVAAAEKAVALDGKSVVSWATAARLYEASGRLGDAAGAFRTLAALDRRGRAEYLTKVAELEARLGRRDEALKAGRDLLAAAPGNPERSRFFSDLCFQLGANEEGLDALRRAARLNEADPEALLNLAEALAREFRTEEAIESYWRAFDGTRELEPKLGLVPRLAELYLQRNQFDLLLARLERLRREEGRQREATLCLAQAHVASGDFGAAHQQLEGLLTADPRDTALLQQLSELAENEGDFAEAAKYQKQLYEIAPGDRAAYRLSQLALRAGDLDLAETVWSRHADGDEDLSRVLQAVDSLMTLGNYASALATTGRLLRKNPGNWEALVREGRALYAMDRPDEAARRFRELLDLRLDDDEESAIVKARRKAPPPTAARPAGTATAAPIVMFERVTVRYRLGYPVYARAMFGLEAGSSSSLASSSWPPSDFGQARIVALAAQLAQSRRENAEDAWLARLREARDKAPNDPRPFWDGVYAGLLRADPRETYEAARALARVAGRDPSADWVYLSSMILRNNPPGVRALRFPEDETDDASPPLLPDEIDMIRDAFRSVVQSNPDWIYGSMVEGVLAELRRTGRAGELDTIYRDLAASANNVSTISVACAMAADRGDLDDLRKLSAAFDRIPARSRMPFTASQGYYIRAPRGVVPIPAYSMAQAMRVKADAKAHAEILRLLDDYWANLRTHEQVAQRARSAKASSTSATRYSYPVFLTKSQRLHSIEYPTPGTYFDYGAILLLRNAFALFQRDDLLSDLLAYVKAAGAGADDPSTALYARLELSALLWWSDEKDEALRELARAIDLAPGDVDLKLTLAELRAQQQDPDEALAVADSVEAVDQAVTRRRELLALRLAVQTGRVERARQAAERLFGFRLDGPTQLQLAAQMQQLGMHDLAEAVLARARRQAGNNTNALVDLMTQYRRQGRVDVAAQVARQILRRAPGQSPGRAGDLEDQAQLQAIQVLAGSGMLEETIERVEAQIQHSPRSLQLHQRLASYYQAAGRRDKLKAVHETIVKLRPDDARLRMQLATQFAQSGETSAALDHYRAVLKMAPSQFGSNFTQVHETFQRANRIEELANLLDQVDLKSLGDYYPAILLIQSLVKAPKTREQGMTLLRKAWVAYPSDRSLMAMRFIADEEFWKRPEAFDYAREAVIPGAALTWVEPWSGMDRISAPLLDSEGRAAALATRLLEVATRENRLDELAADVEAAFGRYPGWQAGKAILGMVRIRQGRVGEGRRDLQTLLADPAARPSYVPLLIVGQELEDNPELEPLAQAVFERALKSDSAPAHAASSFQISADRRLASIYRRTGRNAEARELVLKVPAYYRTLPTSPGSPAVAYRKLITLNAIAAFLLEIGEVADALRVYNEVLVATDDLRAARSYSGVDADSLLRQARDGVDRALHGLNEETLASTLQSLIRSGGGDGNDPVDLVLLVHPRELDKGAVTSLLSSALELAVKDPAALGKVKSGLDAAVKARPGDFAARTAVALLAGAGGDPAGLAEAAAELERTAVGVPLEALPEGSRANARQRTEAARRLGHWLVARACWRHESTREAGDRLATLAVEAARRQSDSLWALAMLREWGQVALGRGDRETAEARWSTLLGLILVDSTGANGPRRPGEAAGGPNPSSVARAPALTLERFQQAAQLARLAAEADMINLSLRAVRESLKGGPPVVPVAMTATPVITRSPTGADGAAADPSVQQVEASLVELDALWRRHKVPPEAMYETLREVVLPAARPGEIFTYRAALEKGIRTDPNAASSLGSLRSWNLGLLLCRGAVAAGRADDLRERVAERQGQPGAKNHAQLLLSLLAEVQKEP